MTQPRVLRNPPIVEAAASLQASLPGDPAAFSSLADELQAEFPVREVVQSSAEPPVFSGVRVANEDKTLYVQLRPDGLILNNVKRYIGGTHLIDKTLSLWQWLAERTRPKEVSCASLYYLNNLDLPLKDGDDLEEYFRASPNLPEGAPQIVGEFLSRISAHDRQRQARAIVIQQLKQQQKAKQPIAVKISLEVRRDGHFPIDTTTLRDILISLRALKNEVFFSLLTEKTVRYYE